MFSLRLAGFVRYELEGGVLFFKDQTPRLAISKDELPDTASSYLIRLPPLLPENAQFVLVKKTSKNRYLLAMQSGARADISRSDSLSAAAARIALFFDHEDPIPHP